MAPGTLERLTAQLSECRFLRRFPPDGLGVPISARERRNVADFCRSALAAMLTELPSPARESMWRDAIG